MDIISGTPDQIAAKILSRQTSAKEGSRPVVCGFLHAPTGFVHFEGGSATRLAAPALGSTPPRIDAVAGMALVRQLETIDARH